MIIRNGRKSTCILIVFIISILFMNMPAYAEDTNANNDTGKNSEINYDQNGSKSAYVDLPLFEETQKLNMPKNTVSYWFEVPKGSIVDDSCYINLYLTMSNTLIEDKSSISLTINDQTLETKWITKIDKTTSCWWKVSIPANVLKIGQPNKLNITTAQRSIEGDCADIDNPSNWVNINKESYLHIGMSKYSAPYLGNVYSYFFDNLKEKNFLNNQFIIPDNKNKSDINGMFKISSAIGKQYPDKDTLSYNVSDNSGDNNSIKNKIYIGSIDKWGQNNELLLPKEELNDNEGFLSINDRSSQYPYYKMLISGKDENGVNKAIKFFSDTDYLKQIQDNELVVKSDINDQQAKFQANEDGLYKFKDFGYSTINLAGAFHQSASFSFTQPKGVQSGKNSYLKVKFNHSNALVSDRSLLTVYIDGVAQGSTKLSASNAEDGELKINIPEKALKEDKIDVKIDCYNYLGKIDCSKDYYDSAWTVISEDSEIYFEQGELGLKPNLVDFPLFNGFNTEDNNKIIMGLPKNYDNNTLKLADLIATRAGQNSKETFNWSSCFSSNELTKEDENNNMIFIGSFDDIDLPEEIKKNLAIDSLGSGEFKIDDKLTILPETLKNKIVLQAIRSPWNFNKKIYVILYDKNVEENLEAFLSDKKLLNQESDQISIVDTNKVVTNFQLDKEDLQPKAPLTIESIKYMIEKKSKMPIYVWMVMFILIVTASILIFKVKKNKFRFKNAEKKMKNINKENLDVNDKQNNNLINKSIDEKKTTDYEQEDSNYDED